MEPQRKIIQYLNSYKIFINQLIEPCFAKAGIKIDSSALIATKSCFEQELQKLIVSAMGSKKSDIELMAVIKESFIPSIERYLTVVTTVLYLIPCSMCQMKNKHKLKTVNNPIPVLVENSDGTLSYIYVCMPHLRIQIEKNSSLYGNDYDKWVFESEYAEEVRNSGNKFDTKFKVKMIDITMECYNIHP